MERDGRKCRMRELYVLLLYLPSTFGRLSQIATRYPYTHVAISLDDSYTYFYAFFQASGENAADFRVY